uniref:(northern house mosquito) hypothetical protein n=1 Tax=Culex pipiens TaxID=7175 RepID=A0A8D8F761_CULPI
MENPHVHISKFYVSLRHSGYVCDITTLTFFLYLSLPLTHAQIHADDMKRTHPKNFSSVLVLPSSTTLWQINPKFTIPFQTKFLTFPNHNLRSTCSSLFS